MVTSADSITRPISTDLPDDIGAGPANPSVTKKTVVSDTYAPAKDGSYFKVLGGPVLRAASGALVSWGAITTTAGRLAGVSGYLTAGPIALAAGGLLAAVQISSTPSQVDSKLWNTLSLVGIGVGSALYHGALGTATLWAAPLGLAILVAGGIYQARGVIKQVSFNDRHDSAPISNRQLLHKAPLWLAGSLAAVLAGGWLGAQGLFGAHAAIAAGSTPGFHEPLRIAGQAAIAGGSVAAAAVGGLLHSRVSDTVANPLSHTDI